MSKRHTVKAGLAALVTAGLAATTFGAAAPAHAALGERSLATVLAADQGFDHNSADFDVLERVVGRVLAAKPDSPVGLLAQGDVPLTAFLPTDGAFRALVKDLTGKNIRSERALYRAIRSTIPVDTLEAVLLYHVLPSRLNAKAVLAADGDTVTTAGGGTFVVKVNGKNVKLVDADPDDQNPRVVVTNINKGNKQIGHAINRVLRPVNL